MAISPADVFTKRRKKFDRVDKWDNRTKKRLPYWVAVSSVGVFLSSRAVTSQVLSTSTSLTSVFGMGTGGPSLSSTPTVFCLPPFLTASL